MGYVVWTLRCEGAQQHYAPLMRAQAEATGAEVRVRVTREGVEAVMREGDERAAAYLASLETLLPASLFLQEASHRTITEPPANDAKPHPRLPLYSAPCPRCQEEMFDVSSRRYYYPFTSCNACGAQAPFVERYPFVREHTSMRFFVPCDACKEELRTNPFRKEYPLVSCVTCGIAVKMAEGKRERFANTKGEYRTLFEVAARAIAGGKRVLVQTLFGYRLFFLPDAYDVGGRTRLIVGDAEALNRLFVLVPEEFHALLSIERPALRLAIKEEALRRRFGASAWCKFADDGMSMLLMRELIREGHAYAAYEEVDATAEADYRVSFDVPVRYMRDTAYFVNRRHRFFVEGERGIYPRFVPLQSTRLSVASPIAGVPYGEGVLFDDAERLEEARINEVYVAQEDTFESGHPHQRRFRIREAALLSVLAEHEALRVPAVGVHMDKALFITYYNGVTVRDIIAPKPFNGADFVARLPQLREGADRLGARFAERFAARYALLAQEGMEDIFAAAAAVMGLEGGIDALHTASLAFLGKGGVQVDTYVRDNAMDDAAFLASIMSYVTADADRAMLAYSIFESLGDFIGEAVAHIARKSGTQRVVLTGETMANQALFGRLMRNLGRFETLYPRTLPVGRANAPVGAQYLP